jgi:diguanylate cyclase (GGDEF)-like protein
MSKRTDPDGEHASSLDPTRRWLLGIMWVLLVAYVAGLYWTGSGYHPVVDGWLGSLTQFVPAAVCWAALCRARSRRLQVGFAASAVTAYAVANGYYIATLAGAQALPFPSPADVGYLLFYPLMLAALIALMYRQLRHLSGPVILDSAVGALGAAAVLAVLLSPVVSSALAEPLSLGTAFALAYPLLNMVVGASVVGIVATVGLDAGRRWGYLIAGLTALTAADVVYALRLADDSYVIGTPLDAGWAIGLTLVAVWVAGSDAGPRPQRGAARRTWALTVPALATAAGLGVLILSSQTEVSLLAVCLASVTLVVAAARTQLAFSQLAKMADLRSQARTDDLTGLPNRRALYSDVPLKLAALNGRPSALLLLDLDRFKEVNDSLGHDVGDRLLVHVSQRLAEQLNPEDLLARLGGDEFALLVSDTGPEQAMAVASRLRSALARPFTLEGITLQANVSIGIALYPDHAKDLTGLLRKADMAMYAAKAARAGHQIYAGTDDSHGDERLRTLQELRGALLSDELILHYQPKINLATGAVSGAEALVRWNHPGRGLLAPASFLPLVEEAGLMHDLTQIVLGKALDQAAVWHERGHPLTVAVNLSASSLIDASLPARISAMIASRGLTEEALMLEITEDFLMADRDRAHGILALLRQSGIQIAIDDFGTGYSSLSYLRDLPIDELKLDRSFVLPMVDNPRAGSLVASTIALAHGLGMRIVAEGVEIEGARADLIRMGCDEAQGYYFSRPLPAVELDAWIAARAAIANGVGFAHDRPGTGANVLAMLPADWIEHRRDDREPVGWIVPAGEGFRPVDRLGRWITAEPVDWLTAEELLEERGIGFLADRFVLRLPDGTERPVRISEASTDGVTVVADEYGSASAVGAGSDRFRLPFPAPDTLRPDHN